jgi:hypothetical protein
MHLVGFIIWKFVKIHGHMDVKRKIMEAHCWGRQCMGSRQQAHGRQKFLQKFGKKT